MKNIYNIMRKTLCDKLDKELSTKRTFATHPEQKNTYANACLYVHVQTLVKAYRRFKKMVA